MGQGVCQRAGSLATLWNRIDALPATPVFTAPLLLQGGFTLAAFTAQRTALDTASTTLHTFLTADPRTFLTGAGFAIPGTAMTYNLFVRLTTGNEAGSDAVTVTRPL